MRKEKFKNVTLVILILIGIGLFSNMWFSEKLWSDGYDFFAFFDIFSSSRDENSATFAISDIIAPRRFIVNGGDKRSIITGTDSGYSRMSSEVLAVFKNTDDSFSPATQSEWRSSLKSRSVLVDFGIPLISELLSQTGITVPENGSFAKILIVPYDSSLNRCVIYFENSVSNEILKTFTETQPSLSALISNHTDGSGALNIPYAFELGFDSVKLDSNEEITQNILLDSTLSLGLSGQSVPAIEINSDFDIQRVDRIIKNFFDSGVSVRRYIEKDGSSVFVNRKSTLKISPDGYIEYTAEAEGKKITNARSTDAQTVSAVMTLVRSISAHYNLSEAKFQLHNVPTVDKNGATNIILNYLAGSVPLLFEVPAGTTVPAVTAKIKDGRLMYFKFNVCRISVLREQTALPSMLKAVDSLYLQAGGEKLEVSDLYISYISDGEGRAPQPSWCARIKNSDRIIIIDGE